MKKVLLASQNKGKIAEFKEMLKGYNVEVVSLLDYPNLPDVEETGTTYEENAILKAETIAKLTNTVVISDDSGLEIASIGNEPGVYSARYAGEGKSHSDNIEKITQKMGYVNQTESVAKYVSVIAVAYPGSKTRVAYGYLDGVFRLEPKGNNGFAYDPHFYLPSIGKTLAEIEDHEKNIISHRYKALVVAMEEASDLIHGSTLYIHDRSTPDHTEVFVGFNINDKHSYHQVISRETPMTTDEINQSIITVLIKDNFINSIITPPEIKTLDGVIDYITASISRSPIVVFKVKPGFNYPSFEPIPTIYNVTMDRKLPNVSHSRTQVASSIDLDTLIFKLMNNFFKLEWISGFNGLPYIEAKVEIMHQLRTLGKVKIDEELSFFIHNFK